MTTLTDFLLARIAEDEAVAMDALAIESIYANATWHWSVVNDGGSRWHPTRHDPARVLAECEAKRRIVEECEASASLAACQPRGSYDEGITTGLLAAMHALAAVYADHPDYRAEWAL